MDGLTNFSWQPESSDDIALWLADEFSQVGLALNSMLSL